MSNLFKPPAGTNPSPGKRVVLQGPLFGPGNAVINADGTLDAGSVVGSAVWGAITGTLADQADLGTALSAKLAAASNLSDVASASTARTNLGLGSLAVLSSIAESNLALTDVTTANVSTTKHGFAPKGDGSTSKFLNANGAYSTPTGTGDMLSTNNLSDVVSASTARTNLGLGTAAVLASSAVAQTANNLSDLANAGTARTNLGLGTAAVLASSAVFQVANNLSEGTAATMRTNLGLGTVATHAASEFLLVASNLSDLNSASTARTNLGLGSAALLASSAVFQTANNLSEGTASTMRTNLGLGSAALLASSAVFQVSNNLSEGTAATMRTNLGLGTAALISSTAGGDLSGTLPSPTVAKINGVAVTGTPSVGYVPTATSGSAATWQAPAGGGLTIGTSAITSGANTKVLYDNSGVVGEYAVSGSGNVAMTTSPTLVTPILGTPSSGDATNLTNIPVNQAKSGAILPGANGGGLVLLEQHTASTSASLDFTSCITGAYDEYQIHFIHVLPATNTVNLFLRMSTNGGSSYDSGNNYISNAFGFSSGGSGVAGGSAVSGIFLNGGDTLVNTSTYGLSGVMTIYDPGGSSLKAINGFTSARSSNGSLFAGALLSGAYNIATAVNAFQIITSSGNIASGIVRCYGVAK